jgi:hypothetical protein
MFIAIYRCCAEDPGIIPKAGEALVGSSFRLNSFVRKIVYIGQCQLVAEGRLRTWLMSSVPVFNGT